MESRRSFHVAGDGGKHENAHTEVDTFCSEGHFLFGGSRLCSGILMWVYWGPWKRPHRDLAWVLDASYPWTRSRASLGAPWWSEPWPKSPFCSPNGLYPKLWETAVSTAKWEMELHALTQGLAFRMDTLSPVSRYLGFFWSSLGWACCQETAQSLASSLAVCVGLLYLPFSFFPPSPPLPCLHESSYLWGGLGTWPGKEKSHLNFICHLPFLL